LNFERWYSIFGSFAERGERNVETVEELKGRIESTQDLQSVVKTMKALAAVNIRQYEMSVQALEDYSMAVEMGLRVVLRNQTGLPVAARRAPKDRMGAIVFGSDQGMCGQLNDQIVTYTLNVMNDLAIEERYILAVGERVMARMEDTGYVVEKYFPVPTGVSDIIPAVQTLLTEIERWNREYDLNQVFIFHSRQLSGASFRPHTIHLLPIDDVWLRRLRETPWPTHALPMYTMEWDPLFSSLIREYLFISLFRAFAESLASENASRLASMQGAEKNIEERLGELRTRFHQQRQMSITEELLDIVAGFEALKGTI
jgi:F-type H+-transporting ATPase subunit gamma